MDEKNTSDPGLLYACSNCSEEFLGCETKFCVRCGSYFCTYCLKDLLRNGIGVKIPMDRYWKFVNHPHRTFKAGYLCDTCCLETFQFSHLK